MANNLKTVIEELVKKGKTSSPTTLTATSGSTTTLGATGATFDKTTSTAYQGRVLWVTYDAGSGTDVTRQAPENEAKPVSTFSGTTLTTAVAFSAAIAPTDLAVLLPSGWGKETTLEAINDRIRSLALPRYLPLTLCPDGDMESSGDTNWAGVGAGTGTKAATAADTLLRRHLAIGGTSDGDGQRSDVINVFEGEVLFVDVAIRCDTGTAQIELYDADAAAVISGTSYTTNEEGFARISFQYSVGTGVERIQVQITQDGATALLGKLGWVSVLSSRRNVYDLPSAVADAERIESLRWLPKGSTIANDATHLWDRKLERWGQPMSLRDYEGANPQRVMAQTGQEGVLFIFFKATGTALSAMTDTTVFPLEPLVAGALWGIYERLWHRWPDGQYLQMARVQERRYSGYLSELGLNTPIKRDWVQRKV